MTDDTSFTFKHIFKRISTWLAILSGSATSILTWYFTQPPEAQQHVPGWIIAACVWVSLVSASGIPVATSYRQRSLKG